MRQRFKKFFRIYFDRSRHRVQQTFVYVLHAQSSLNFFKLGVTHEGFVKRKTTWVLPVKAGESLHSRDIQVQVSLTGFVDVTVVFVGKESDWFSSLYLGALGHGGEQTKDLRTGRVGIDGMDAARERKEFSQRLAVLH